MKKTKEEPELKRMQQAVFYALHAISIQYGREVASEASFNKTAAWGAEIGEFLYNLKKYEEKKPLA